MNLKSSFFKYLAQTSPEPIGLQIKKASGHYLIDQDGKRYFDLISGFSVNNIGHRNSDVLKAIRHQSSKYLHTIVYGEFIQNPQVQYAQFLIEQLNCSLNSVYFTNSGTEATEAAMKLAKKVSSRSEFVAFNNAYHGSSQGALSLMSDGYYSDSFKPLLPHIKFIDINNLDHLDTITTKTAAVFIELIQSETGYTPIHQQYLDTLIKQCKNTGTLIILDEIQSGIGRTGTFFAFQQYQFVPDILLSAKALGGGMPIGAFFANHALMSQLSHDPLLGHITTFGGHPVSAAAGLAAAKYVFKKDLLQHVNQKENEFRNLLQHNNIINIQGKGLLLSIELKDFETTKIVLHNCLKDGLISDWFLFANNKIRIAPPLTITEKEIKKICQILLKHIDNIKY